MKIMMCAAVMALATQAFAGGEGWTADFDAAKAQAAKEGKDLLIDFTGSDWCGWCIKLNKEVFAHDAFKTGVKDSFVLVELDFPKDKSKLSEATQAQNKELGEKYAVRGYPTIMLCDAQGRPYAKTGYQQGGPENYVKHLNVLREGRVVRDKAFAAAEMATGAEKAKALIQVLESIAVSEALIANFYGDVADQIKAADPSDESGFVKSLEQKKRITEFEKQLNEKARARDMKGALALADGILSEGAYGPMQTQQLMMTRAMILANLKRFDDSLQQIDAALEVAPDGKNNDGIKNFRKRIEALKVSLDAKAAEQKQAEQAKLEAAEKAKQEAEAAEQKPAEQPEAAEEPIRVRDK